MKKKIAVVPGDGIGPEIMEAALLVLRAIGERFGHEFRFEHAPAGGAAFDLCGEHLPASTLEVCRSADALLFGSVGGPLSEAHLPKWKGCEANSILALRKAFSFYANFRPVQIFPALADLSPLKKDTAAGGCDILFVRELIGDIYFGERRRGRGAEGRFAIDTAEYDETKIRNIAVAAFRAARSRSNKVTSVDKANVLDTSRLWREVVDEVARDFPEVELEHMLVDNCAMQIVLKPARFDVILTGNMFGDILSDLGAALPGSLGLTPSASFNLEGFGLYEPSGGSAPDIAGRGIANPLAQILSAAMMLRWSFGMAEEASAMDRAVARVLAGGKRTPDIMGAGKVAASTLEMGEEVASEVRRA